MNVANGSASGRRTTSSSQPTASASRVKEATPRTNIHTCATPFGQSSSSHDRVSPGGKATVHFCTWRDPRRRTARFRDRQAARKDLIMTRPKFNVMNTD
ncbi:Uu.00g070250.m01.CDS01 [Anthostomella pinea]|uniref:Uu.00g070250.m01.CDS01 n=1 Tax=Anthostomella pinea TaxID=933095 RepID=A0AAI8VVH7_9PEZI|nr:Uu.00g070250.m01.CDS01 [Anthostomella pinea]